MVRALTISLMLVTATAHAGAQAPSVRQAPSVKRSWTERKARAIASIGLGLTRVSPYLAEAYPAGPPLGIAAVLIGKADYHALLYFTYGWPVAAVTTAVGTYHAGFHLLMSPKGQMGLQLQIADRVHSAGAALDRLEEVLAESRQTSGGTRSRIKDRAAEALRAVEKDIGVADDLKDFVVPSRAPFDEPFRLRVKSAVEQVGVLGLGGPARSSPFSEWLAKGSRIISRSDWYR
jgi:hypothetical protein